MARPYYPAAAAPPHAAGLGHLGPAPGPQPSAAAVPQTTAFHPADFAREQPDKYRAFEAMAVRSSEAGTDIKLHDRMCEDKHIPDFLLCLQSWLWSNQGDPRSTGRPWRIGCLDLSRNKLSNDSISKVVDMMKCLDVRVERLWLGGNLLEASGMTLVTEYIWNCLDPIMELDLADNEVVADAAAGSDVVSDLLRCLYNHSSYPRIVSEKDASRGSTKVVPLTIYIGGNFVRNPKRILQDIKAGREQHVQIRKTADPYRYKGEEFLAVFLPNFAAQNATNGKLALTAGDEEAKAKTSTPVEKATEKASREKRSKRPREERRREETREAEVVAPARSRRRRRSRSGRRRAKLTPVDTEVKPAVVLLPADSRGRAHDASPVRGEPEHWQPAGDGASSNGSASLSPRSRHHHSRAPEVQPEDPPAAASAPSSPVPAPSSGGSGSWVTPSFSEPEQKELQQAVSEKILSLECLDDEEGTRSMLSEFVVCMAVTGKEPQEMQTELKGFFGDHTEPFMEWFINRVQQQRAKSGGYQ